MEWLPWAVNAGGLGAALTVLFLALRSGALWTKTQVETALKAKDESVLAALQSKDAYALLLLAYIKRLEDRNDALDERNDILAGQVAGAIEVSRATGMLRALPSETAERLTG